MRLFGRKRETDQSVPMTTAEELKQLLDRGERPIVLDVRQPNAYVEYPGAIPGSVRIPPAELPDRYSELPRSGLIVVYCT